MPLAWAQTDLSSCQRPIIGLDECLKVRVVTRCCVFVPGNQIATASRCARGRDETRAQARVVTSEIHPVSGPALTVVRQAGEQARRHPLQRHVYDPVNQLHSSTFISLPYVVECRRQQEILVVESLRDQYIPQTKMVCAIIRRKPSQQTPLGIVLDHGSQATVNLRIMTVCERTPGLADALESGVVGEDGAEPAGLRAVLGQRYSPRTG